MFHLTQTSGCCIKSRKVRCFLSSSIFHEGGSCSVFHWLSVLWLHNFYSKPCLLEFPGVSPRIRQNGAICAGLGLSPTGFSTCAAQLVENSSNAGNSGHKQLQGIDINSWCDRFGQYIILQKNCAVGFAAVDSAVTLHEAAIDAAKFILNCYYAYAVRL